MSQETMRRLIDLLEQAPNRDSVEATRRARLLRRDPPVKVADSSLGPWYRMPRSVFADPEMANLLGVDEDFAAVIRDHAEFAHRHGQGEETGPTKTFYIPGIMLVSRDDEVNRLWMHANRLEFQPNGSANLAAAITGLARHIGFVSVMDLGGYELELMPAADGSWNWARDLLISENQEVTVPGLRKCWRLSSDWVRRAERWLKMESINTTYASKNPDHLFLVDTGEGHQGWYALVAFRNGKMVGATGSKSMGKDKLARAARLLAPLVGASPDAAVHGGRSTKIKPGSNFHRMLAYIAANPGSPRSGWVTGLGNDPTQMRAFDSSPDGMAQRLDLITHRDPGTAQGRYQMRITPRGQEVLDRLNAGEDLDVNGLLEAVGPPSRTNVENDRMLRLLRRDGIRLPGWLRLLDTKFTQGSGEELVVMLSVPADDPALPMISEDIHVVLHDITPAAINVGIQGTANEIFDMVRSPEWKQGMHALLSRHLVDFTNDLKAGKPDWDDYIDLQSVDLGHRLWDQLIPLIPYLSRPGGAEVLKRLADR